MNVIYKEKGEWKVNFKLAILLLMFISFILGIGFSLAFKIVDFLFTYIESNHLFIYARVFPALELLLLSVTVIVVAIMANEFKGKKNE